MNPDIRVRFAPSPSGPLHVGNARTALFNYLFAKNLNGKFILRIEDTDQERSNSEAVSLALESLRWMGIEWDEGPEVGGDYGPYYQSQRLEIYNSYLEKLINNKSAYPCFCTTEEVRKRAVDESGNVVYDGKCRNLSEDEIQQKFKNGEKASYRLKVENSDVIFNDLVRGDIKTNPSLFGDFIIKRPDGFPVYNFAVVIDDALMKISHVLRGDDHLSNTPKQLLIYKALDFTPPIFGHTSMILGENKEKLSKRHGATSVYDFKKQGYLSTAFNNHLALLGWSPKDGEEIIEMPKLIKQFDGTRLNSSPAVFNYQKLDFLNKTRIQHTDKSNLPELFRPFLQNSELTVEINSLDKEKLLNILEICKNYCTKLSDISHLVASYISKDLKKEIDLSQLISNEEAKQLKECAIKIFSATTSTYITNEEFSKLTQTAKEELSLKGKKFFMPIRILITGEEHGPDMSLIFQILTRETVLYRLNQQT